MEKLEEQIKETYMKAFWDKLDEDPVDMEHLGKLLEEIVGALCSFVPSRTDIHQMIRQDLLSGEVDWHLQEKLLTWAARFQAPIYDQVTDKWKKRLPEKLSDFLREYYQHLEKINKQVWQERKKIADRADNLKGANK